MLCKIQDCNARLQDYYWLSKDFSPGSKPLYADVDLKYVLIHFDTATYDQIERDKKITLEGQLGLIGGTMGLLTGFSILNGVEIIYHLGKFARLLYANRREKQSAHKTVNL